jgi:iron complex outermembrane recepter protein
MKTSRLATAVAVPLMAFSSLLVCYAYAQQPSPTESSGLLAEIVVTATKRATTAQETAASLTAISGVDLQDRGITDLTAVAQSVPGVAFRTSGPGQTELEMRGMTSSGGNSSTVGFYLDDIPLTAPAAAQNGKVVIDPNLYDLNRIEVLRGPQGTLYGSGSEGGTIKLVPNAPDLHQFDSSAQVILGGTDGGDTLNRSENAFVNVPLIDNTLALRLVGSLESLSGWIDRIVIKYPDFPAPVNATTRGNVAAAPVAADYSDVNSTNLRSVRAALLWKPTDRLSIEPTFLYQEITQGGLSLIDSPPGTLAGYQPYDSPEPFLDRIDISGLNIQYHFDIADLNSTTSNWVRDENLRQDGAEEIATAIGVPIYPPQGFGPTYPTPLEDDKSKQLSEELRVTSSGDTQFKWLVGYFYQDFESDFDYFGRTPDAAPLTGTTNANTYIQATKILQNSFFGEASYSFLPQLTVTAGLRRYYYHESNNTAASGWASPSAGPNTEYFSTSERDTGVTPKFNLSYQLDKELLLYGTVAQGFRPGGGNYPVAITGDLGLLCLANLEAIGLRSPPEGFKPDKVLSYELGEKFRDSDGRITINSAAYFENWQHIQLNIPLPCGYIIEGNSADAHIYGLELEVSMAVASGLVASVSSSWLHAEYIANTVPTTTIGDRVQDIPEITLASSLAYRHGISDSLTLIGRVDNNYVGSRIDTTAQANYLPPYDLTNIRLGVEGGNWSSTLFVNNVTNKLAFLTNAIAINVNSPTFNRTAVQQPRTFGIDLSYHFER